MTRIESNLSAMNLSELPSRLLPPAGAEAGAVQAAGRSVSAQLHAATGNQLLELDVWGNTGAAERVLGTPAALNAPSTVQLDQLAHHILAPLG
ncbi:hypothetical protein [Dyella acidiphila]|uniref:Uncharacterized protein n=1 Tax=Dyella acidiphila TaxID=2775866 RepID=A0ABR9GBI4_9GAMM|nr:hypothetical protein [Dyella acidiphila]MBE1161412.1 hypothetical protein [Dyella acidiphila]